MKNRFQIIVVYDDCTSKTETTPDIQRALNAVSIYWMDNDCSMIHIYDNLQNADILTYNRPN